MVTENIETDFDITNGARSKIVSIVLYSDEPKHNQERIVELKYLLASVLVKLSRT